MGVYNFVISNAEHGSITVGKSPGLLPQTVIDTYTVSYSATSQLINAQGINVADRAILSSSITYRREITCDIKVGMGSGQIRITIPRTQGNNYIWGDDDGEAYASNVGAGKISSNWTSIDVNIDNVTFSSNAVSVTTDYYNANKTMERTYENQNDSISGSYTVPEYTISIQSNSNEMGEVIGYDPLLNEDFLLSRDFEYQTQSIKLTAIPKGGYIFVNWTNAHTGQVMSTAQTHIITPVSDSITYQANFAPITYTIEFNANGGTGFMESKTLLFTDSYIIPTSQFIGPVKNVVFEGNGSTDSNYPVIKAYNVLFNNSWYCTINNSITLHFATGVDVAKYFTMIPNETTLTFYANWNNDIILKDMPQIPKKQYHSFEGWLNLSDSIIYQEGDLKNQQVNYLNFNNFIAQWKKNQFRTFLYDKNNNLKRLPHLFLKNKKIKKIFIYIPGVGIKEI